MEEVIGMCNMTHENKITAKGKIAGIRAGGNTNLSGGLFKAIEQQVNVSKLTENFAEMNAVRSSTVRSVFLLTDGLANAGVTDPERITRIVKGMQATLPPGDRIILNTFGFGSDHDPEFLGQLAEANGGAYHYIEKQEQVPTVFGEALGGLLSMFCQNVEVTITPCVGVRLKKLDTDFAQQMFPDGSIRVTVGDLYADERKDIVVEAEIDPLLVDEAANGSGQSQTLLSFLVKYLDIEALKLQEVRAELVVKRPAQIDQATQQESELVKFHLARLAASKVLLEAKAAADAGNLFQGWKKLDNLRSQLDRIALASDSLDLSGLKDDVTSTMDTFCDKPAYDLYGKKRAYMLSKAHYKQRSCGAYKDGSTMPYSTKSQRKTSSLAAFAVNNSIPPTGTQTDYTTALPQAPLSRE